MALVDLVKGKDVPKPNNGPQGNIPTQSPQGAGIIKYHTLQEL